MLGLAIKNLPMCQITKIVKQSTNKMLMSQKLYVHRTNQILKQNYFSEYP